MLPNLLPTIDEPSYNLLTILNPTMYSVPHDILWTVWSYAHMCVPTRWSILWELTTSYGFLSHDCHVILDGCKDIHLADNVRRRISRL